LFGCDTVETVVYEQPFYEYTVDHLNGETTTVHAHDHRYEEGFCEFVTVPGVTYTRLLSGTLAPPWHLGNWDVQRRLEGIQEIEREQVDVDRWEWDRDMADGTIVEKRLNGVVYE
jgi:hypothetical protein